MILLALGGWQVPYLTGLLLQQHSSEHLHLNPALAEVFLACTTHALSTESEEVMGLLLGDLRVGPLPRSQASVQPQHCIQCFQAQHHSHQRVCVHSTIVGRAACAAH